MHQFTLDVTLDGSLPFIYAAFHEPEYLSEWFAPGNCSVTQVMSNFKEGGRYRIKMREPNGAEISLTGEYVTVLANEKLAFSWAWEDNLEDSVMTAVDVYFEAVNDDQVRLVIIQSGFANQDETDQHQHAWMSCLEKLAALASETAKFN